MILNNYKKLLRSQNMVSDTDSSWTATPTTSNVISYLWNPSTMSNSHKIDVNPGNNYQIYWFICVGSGDTAVTTDDICMDNIITTLTQVTATATAGTNDIIKHVEGSFNNSTESNIIVKEVGFGVQFWSSNISNSWTALLGRKVLTTPVTIAPGETYNFSYEIQIPS